VVLARQGPLAAAAGGAPVTIDRWNHYDGEVIEAMDTSCAHQERPYGACGTIPELERLCYFFGQMLEPAGFRAEQAYFTTLLSLLGRHTASWGVACGLDVGVSTGQPEGYEDEPTHKLLVLEVTPGVALDCGRLVVLRKHSSCRLWGLTDKSTRDAFLGGTPVCVSIEYVERPVRPSRPAGEAWCDPMAAPQYGRIRDETRLRVSLETPEHQARDTCLGHFEEHPALVSNLHEEPERLALLATADGASRPTMEHLASGVARQFRSEGRLAPPDDLAALTDLAGSIP
jgi:hypothetical protein